MEFERTVELTLGIGLEIVVKVKVMWRAPDVIEGGSLGVLENGGEEFAVSVRR